MDEVSTVAAPMPPGLRVLCMDVARVADTVTVVGVADEVLAVVA